MAAGGFKEFVAGETLDEDEINDFLMQGMLVFAGTAARGSAITAPVEGQFSFLTDSDSVEFYDGSAWVELSTTPGAAVISGTTGSPTVTSGTVIGGTAYDIYKFTGDGSITVSDAGFADLLVVGGGGGADNGGAGAGDLILSEQEYLPSGTFTVSVGAGGSGDRPALAGGLSELVKLTSFAGGGGATNNNAGDESAASAGGGAGAFAGGVSLARGSNGGAGATGAGGGGGGFSAAGADATSNNGGAGGAGTAVLITGSSVDYSSGGGGGGVSSGGAAGGASAGAGNTITGTNAPANQGGGGGGGWDNPTLAGNGGSGVVIVRVAV